MQEISVYNPVFRIVSAKDARDIARCKEASEWFDKILEAAQDGRRKTVINKTISPKNKRLLESLGYTVSSRRLFDEYHTTILW